MDKSTRDKLAKVHPELARRVAELIENMEPRDIRVVQGLRTFAEQDALYAQGRSRKGPIVTKARGGQSNHNFGLAVDLCPFTDGQPAWGDNAAFNAIGKAAAQVDLEWGGSWKTITDKPHVQLAGLTVKQCKALYDQGGIPAVWKRIDQIHKTDSAAATSGNKPVALRDEQQPATDDPIPNPPIEQPPSDTQQVVDPPPIAQPQDEVKKTQELDTGEGAKETVQITTKNEQDVNETAQIEGPRPYNDIGLKDTLIKDAKPFLPANGGLQMLSDYAQQATGWPPWLVAMIGKLALIVLVITICWLLYRLISWAKHTWVENERVKLLATINSDTKRKNVEIDGKTKTLPPTETVAEG